MPSLSIAPSREIPAGKESKTNMDATASSTELGSESTGEIGTARTPWYGTSAFLVSEIMGTGVLGLPNVAITLGWTAALISIPLFAMFAAYAGFQLRTVKLAHPEVKSFGDAATLLVGPRFGTFTKYCMLLNWGSLAVYYIIAIGGGIGNISSAGLLSCNMGRTIVAALLLIIPTQCRDFHMISKYLSAPSTLAIVVAIVLIIVSLVHNDDWAPADKTTVGVEPGTTVFDFLQSLSSIVFAYQGQSIFMELMSEMKKPKEFTKSLNVAYLLMVIVYAATVIIAYGFEGNAVEGFLPDSLSVGKAKTAVGVLVVFHVMVAYVIAIQPFHMWLHSTFFPKTFNSSSCQGRTHWFCITVCYIIFAWVIVNLIPFFGDLQALIGSTLGAPIVFGWPSLFYLLVVREKAIKNANDDDDEETAAAGSSKKLVSLCEAWFGSVGQSIHSSVSLLFLIVVTILFLVLGTWGGVLAIAEDIASSGRPFHC